MTSDHSKGHQLRFTSSTSSPLCYVAGKALSLGQFRSDIEQLSSQFPDDGDILIYCTGRYAFSVALLASWLHGKSVVLPPNHLHKTLQNIRKHHHIAFECDDDWAQQLLTHQYPVAHGSWEPTLPDMEDAVQLFTSGSTGAPKAISKSIANLLDEAHAIAAQFDWPAGPIVASVPPQHLYGLTFSILLPWVLGRAWMDDIPHYASDIIQTLRQSNGQTLISVPTQYKAILEDRTDLSGIFCVSAAAPLTPDIAQKWRQQYDDDILEIYGSTETGVVAHRQQLKVSEWQAFPQVTLSSERHLLKVQSPFVGNEFTGGFNTADRTTVPKQGCFKLLGRADSIIKIAGKRVSLTDIEDSICACSGVAEAAVIAVPAKGVIRDIAIWAAVVADEDYLLSTKSLLSDLRDKLAGIEIPRRVMVVEKLPRTSNGKLPVEAIRKLFKTQDATRV